MGGLEKSCKKSYSQQVGSFIKLALSTSAAAAAVVSLRHGKACLRHSVEADIMGPPSVEKSSDKRL